MIRDVAPIDAGGTRSDRSARLRFRNFIVRPLARWFEWIDQRAVA
jgi:hypothetical protein